MRRLVLAGLLLASCDYASRWEGRYTTQPLAAPDAQVALWLQPDGRGQWVVQAETTVLRWEERRGALWLHARTGAVMIATPGEAGQILIIEVPAVGRLTFRKVAP